VGNWHRGGGVGRGLATLLERKGEVCKRRV